MRFQGRKLLLGSSYWGGSLCPPVWTQKAVVQSEMRMDTPCWARQGNGWQQSSPVLPSFLDICSKSEYFVKNSVCCRIGRPWTWSSPAPSHPRLEAARGKETWSGAEFRALDCKSKASLFTFGEFLERIRLGLILFIFASCIIPTTALSI